MNDVTGNLFTTPACAIPALKPFPAGKHCYLIIKLFQKHGWVVTGDVITDEYHKLDWTQRMKTIRNRAGDDGCIENEKWWVDGICFTKYTVPERFRSVLRSLAPDGGERA